MNSFLLKNVIKHTKIRKKLKKIDFFNKNEWYKSHIHINEFNPREKI